MADGPRETGHVVVRPGDTGEARPHDPTGRDEPLLGDADAAAFRQRWDDVQARFVDDPSAAVRDGDRLVHDLLETLAARAAAHREGVERSERAGGEADTEQLRLALQSYRALFERLLTT